MRLSSIRYLIREGFRNIWQNRFMAIASIGVLTSCLLLTGGAYLVFVNIDHKFEWVYGQNVAVAFAKEDVTPEQAVILVDKIKGITNVADVEFMSRDQLLERYRDTLPEALYEDFQGDKNPYPDAYIVTFSDLAAFDQTMAQIRQIPEIESTQYDEGIAKTLTRIRSMVLMIGSWIILLLFLVALFIIANTIKLTVYNRRLEISIMKSVGATNAFIRVPFVIEGMVLGLMASVLSYGILYVVYGRVFKAFGTDLMGGLVQFSSVWSTVLLGFLAVGILTGAVGSAISVRRYLKKEGGISSVI